MTVHLSSDSKLRRIAGVDREDEPWGHHAFEGTIEHGRKQRTVAEATRGCPTHTLAPPLSKSLMPAAAAALDRTTGSGIATWNLA